MSANNFKRLNTSDTFVVPYVANKSWDIVSSSFAANQIIINIGVNYGTSSLFNPDTDYKTNGQYDRLVYNSVNLLYYPGFLSQYNDTSSLQNTFYNDGTLSTSSYYRGHIDLGNKDTVKFFPTASGSVIYVLNIPKTLTSDKILPTTFEAYFGGEIPYDAKIYDDGNYNLFYSGSDVRSAIPGVVISSSMQIGNIFYENNVAIITIVPNNIRPKGWRGRTYSCQQASPSPTPTVTPTISVTPSVTPSITVTPTSTPTISISSTPDVTPSVTPTVTKTPSVTPTVTPSVTKTPSVTPTPTPSSNYNYYNAELWTCEGGSACTTDYSQVVVASATALTTNNWVRIIGNTNNIAYRIKSSASYTIGTPVMDPASSSTTCGAACNYIPLNEE